jgi:hypothetical protein
MIYDAKKERIYSVGWEIFHNSQWALLLLYFSNNILIFFCLLGENCNFVPPPIQNGVSPSLIMTQIPCDPVVVLDESAQRIIVWRHYLLKKNKKIL